MNRFSTLRVQLNLGRHKEIAVLRFGKTVTDESSLVEDEWSGGSYINPPASGNGYSANGPVSNADFAKLKATVSANYFDDDKLANAKIVLKITCLPPTRLPSCANWFIYDDSRIACQICV